MSVLAIISFLALSSIGVWLLYGARDFIRLGWASYRWRSTEGTIIDSRDSSFTSSGVGGTSGASYGVRVKFDETAHDYEYQVAGRTFRCSTYCFGGWADNARAFYAIGAKVTVYYDPQRPESAVLRPGLQLGAMIGLVFIGGGVLCLVL